MSQRSLRFRLLLGAMLWTGGLLAAAMGVFALLLRPHLLESHGGSLDVWHRAWVDPWTIAVLAFAALALAVAGLAVVRRALRSLDALRARLTEVRGGASPRLEGAYASEVQPLVDDLNALLVQQEDAIARARTRAGELAHALKTPLAVLESEVAELEAAGIPESAAVVAGETRRMTRQVRFHLAQSRVAGRRLGLSCDVETAVTRLIATLERLHRDRDLRLNSELDAGCRFRGAEEDFEEMLGNLMDNACKWASSRVRVGGRCESGELVLTVDDDGSGLPEELRDRVFDRGERLDSHQPGSGLGLAIVREIAELYGGSVELSAAPLGGLRAVLRLPGTRKSTASRRE